MIHKQAFHIGQKVKFQDATFTWREGEVVDIKWRKLKIVGPSGRIEEAQPTKLTVAFRDALKRGWTEREFPVKRVRPVEISA